MYVCVCVCVCIHTYIYNPRYMGHNCFYSIHPLVVLGCEIMKENSITHKIAKFSHYYSGK